MNHQQKLDSFIFVAFAVLVVIVFGVVLRSEFDEELQYHQSLCERRNGEWIENKGDAYYCIIYVEKLKP